MTDTSVVLPVVNLAKRPILAQTIPSGTQVFRVTTEAHRDSPAPFRPLPGTRPRADHRFHSPSGLYRVAYFGLGEEAAFVESHVRAPSYRRLLPTRPGLFLVSFRIPGDVTVAVLARNGLARAGATTGSVTGPFDVSGAWGEAVFRHEAHFDGLIHPSARASHLECLVLFDRAGAVPENRLRVELRMDQEPLRGWAARYRIGWVRS